MKQRIAIVGGGVFGATTAIELAKQGHEVALFERDLQILKGGTANSQNRLHLGLHYPRDLETAIQSRIGFDKFTQKYPEIVRSNFDNYYAISASNSKVTSEQFKEFAKLAGIELYEPLSEPSFGISTKSVDGLWKCDEGVIDIDKFRTRLESELISHQVEVHLGTEIFRIIKNDNTWVLQTSELEEFNDFNFIIRATYGCDHIESSDVNLRSTQYEFHRTLILEVSSQNKTEGITIVDGDFLTVLPKGFSENFLVYAPSISVLDRQIGPEPKLEWDVSLSSLKKAEQALLRRVETWLPKFEIEEIESRMITTRSIQPNVSKTDRRISEIRWLNQSIVEIWSGKIDHCIEISEIITSQIKEKSGESRE